MWWMKIFNKNIYVWMINDEKLMFKIIKKGIFVLIIDRLDLVLKLFDSN